MEFREINKIVRNLNLYKNKVSKNHELNDTEFELVRYISKREYRQMNEVAEYLNVDKALVTRMSRKLESLGYIEILEDQSDKRKKLLKCLDKGFKIKDTMFEVENKYFEYVTSSLSDEEKAEFLKYVNKVYLKSKAFRKANFTGIKDEK